MTRYCLELTGLQHPEVRYLEMNRDAITRPTAAQSAVMKAEFQACAWLVSQDCRVWRIVVAGLVLQFSSTASDADTGGPPPPPAHVFLTFLAPGAGDQVPTSLTVRLLIDLWPLPPPRTKGWGTEIHRHPASGPTTPTSFNPTLRGDRPSKLFAPPLRLDLAEIVVRPGFPIPTGFHFDLVGDLLNRA